jgi:hypothetical protein
LREQEQVVAAASFGVGSAHVESAEWMYANKGACAFAVQVQVAHEKFFACILDVFWFVAVSCASQSKICIIGKTNRFFEVFRFGERKNRSEDFFF